MSNTNHNLESNSKTSPLDQLKSKFNLNDISLEKLHTAPAEETKAAQLNKLRGGNKDISLRDLQSKFFNSSETPNIPASASVDSEKIGYMILGKTAVNSIDLFNSFFKNLKKNPNLAFSDFIIEQVQKFLNQQDSLVYNSKFCFDKACELLSSSEKKMDTINWFIEISLAEIERQKSLVKKSIFVQKLQNAAKILAVLAAGATAGSVGTLRYSDSVPESVKAVVTRSSSVVKKAGGASESTSPDADTSESTSSDAGASESTSPDAGISESTSPDAGTPESTPESTYQPTGLWQTIVPIGGFIMKSGTEIKGNLSVIAGGNLSRLAKLESFFRRQARRTGISDQVRLGNKHRVLVIQFLRLYSPNFTGEYSKLAGYKAYKVTLDSNNPQITVNLIPANSNNSTFTHVFSNYPMNKNDKQEFLNKAQSHLLE
jgi:hypothetical protein